MSDNVQYLVVIEKSKRRYGAYVPDLPSCVAIGASREEVLELIREAIENHLQDLRERGEAIPQPSASSETVVIAAA
jgi:predicted RNase H-like HicB family nuclease